MRRLSNAAPPKAPLLERVLEALVPPSVANFRLDQAHEGNTDLAHRRWRSLLRSLERVGIWRQRTIEQPQVALLRNAEFQIMLSELRYPPIPVYTYVVRDGHPSRAKPSLWAPTVDTPTDGRLRRTCDLKIGAATREDSIVHLNQGSPCSECAMCVPSGRAVVESDGPLGGSRQRGMNSS